MPLERDCGCLRQKSLFGSFRGAFGVGGLRSEIVGGWIPAKHRKGQLHDCCEFLERKCDNALTQRYTPAYFVPSATVQQCNGFALKVRFWTDYWVKLKTFGSILLSDSLRLWINRPSHLHSHNTTDDFAYDLGENLEATGGRP